MSNSLGVNHIHSLDYLLEQETQLFPDPLHRQVRSQSSSPPPLVLNETAKKGTAVAQETPPAVSEDVSRYHVLDDRLLGVRCMRKGSEKTRVTQQQQAVLEEIFALSSSPSLTFRNTIAHSLKLPVRYVNIWFQNRRAREKKRDNRKEKNEEEIIQLFFPALAKLTPSRPLTDSSTPHSSIPKNTLPPSPSRPPAQTTSAATAPNTSSVSSSSFENSSKKLLISNLVHSNSDSSDSPSIMAPPTRSFSLSSPPSSVYSPSLSLSSPSSQSFSSSFRTTDRRVVNCRPSPSRPDPFYQVRETEASPRSRSASDPCLLVGRSLHRDKEVVQSAFGTSPFAGLSSPLMPVCPSPSVVMPSQSPPRWSSFSDRSPIMSSMSSPPILESSTAWSGVRTSNDPLLTSFQSRPSPPHCSDFHLRRNSCLFD
eukprot:TRINITY_DN7209_c0_g1_i1.p1 TRINITY_DN7209_c0_g1~~TRINITY_DN7209_c0_g1_i1.p1  ORF type:complete len:424 (-),score=83.05 TRINITY_DN7209_c0_g1_i1:52-1323(-)